MLSTEAPAFQKGTREAEGAPSKQWTIKWTKTPQPGMMGIVDSLTQEEVFIFCAPHRINPSRITAYQHPVTHLLQVLTENRTERKSIQLKYSLGNKTCPHLFKSLRLTIWVSIPILYLQQKPGPSGCCIKMVHKKIKAAKLKPAEICTLALSRWLQKKARWQRKQAELFQNSTTGAEKANRSTSVHEMG